MVLLIDNYDSFTWNLVQRFGELNPAMVLGRDLVVIRNDAVTPDQIESIDPGAGSRAGPPSHIVISPGPCTPAEAGVSGAVIERFMGRVPILGVCLGHQCMGAVHGMTVARHVVPMHGKTSLIHHDGRGIFRGVPSPMEATRYHSLVVLPDSIPAAPGPGQDGWVVSAWAEETIDDGPDRGSVRRVVMGLRRVWGDSSRAPVEGVQFHPESFLTVEGPKLLANFLGMGPRPVLLPAAAHA